jgi:hypothetical protein
MRNIKPKLIFKFDKEKDLFNIWETCNKDNSFGRDFTKNVPQKIISICKGKNFEDCKNELEKVYKDIYDSKLIPIFLKAVNDSWKEINDEFFKRLEKIMKKPIYQESFIGYLTLAGRCPYILKENAFYFNFFSSIINVLQTAGHEIMHLQFHNTYWNQIEKEIGNKKIHDLKEALTVLLNLEFKDLWFVEDKGYEMHKELRNFIANEWKKEKDFNKLIKNCILFIKKNTLS